MGGGMPQRASGPSKMEWGIARSHPQPCSCEKLQSLASPGAGRTLMSVLQI